MQDNHFTPVAPQTWDLFQQRLLTELAKLKAEVKVVLQEKGYQGYYVQFYQIENGLWIEAASNKSLKRAGKRSQKCGKSSLLISSVIHPVSVGPGSTAFTVMPREATSAASVMVKASIAPFVAT